MNDTPENLLEKLKDYSSDVYTPKALEQNLKEQFGDRILITNVSKRKGKIVTFRDSAEIKCF